MTNTLPNFDENGNLPLGCYKPTFEEIKERFVNNFQSSNSRSSIFDGYLEFSIRICDEMPSAMIQLLNGSFTTDKENPGDIDFVIIFDGECLTPKEIDQWSHFMNNKTIKDTYHCHSFPLVKYDSSKSDLYKYYLKKKEYWLDCWGSDRNDNPKGIIKVKMDKKGFSRCKK